jgi:hypothetical protein
VHVGARLAFFDRVPRHKQLGFRATAAAVRDARLGVERRVALLDGLAQRKPK